LLVQAHRGDALVSEQPHPEERPQGASRRVGTRTLSV